ncbi:MAG: hypothetical protein KGJ41_07230 [Rhodospirillales bacterium]|nr:hypothetical protein [Rhodospirillales bacterium]MDE2198798.1 hypothetical protein [Rhodospirillales bacterium]MDE2574999.1 hypothetical protein [Rhodospirillales bacterium]
MKAALLAGALLCGACPPALAQVKAAQVTPAIADAAPDIMAIGAFVDHRLALQLSDADPAKQALVLSVANNVLAAYGPDRVAIEIVAFGPGVDLLRQGSPNQSLVDSLVAQGVRFDICLNTVQTIERDTGKPYKLNPNAHPVTAGVAQLLLLAEHGFTIIRP